MEHLTLGEMLQIIEIAGLLGGGSLFLIQAGRLAGNQTKITEYLSAEVADLKFEMKEVNKTIAQVAVQNSRLDRLEEDIQDIRHGRGLL